MRLIRKQKNRRLYDTTDKRNVTLQELASLIGRGESIQVEDGVSGDDITRGVMLQIVMEQESYGQDLLSQPFLEALIRLSSNPMQQMASGYLDASMATFERYQKELTTGWQAKAATASVDPSAQAAALTDMARESLKSWMTLQRSIFDAWAAPVPGDSQEKD